MAAARSILRWVMRWWASASEDLSFYGHIIADVRTDDVVADVQTDSVVADAQTDSIVIDLTST